MVCNLTDQLHVVGDYDRGDSSLLNSFDYFLNFSGFGFSHTSRWLIQKKQAWFANQCATYLQQLLFNPGQFTAHPLNGIIKPNKPEHLK